MYKSILAFIALFSSINVFAEESAKLYCVISKNDQIEEAQVFDIQNGGAKHSVVLKNGIRLVVGQNGPFSFALVSSKRTHSRVETNTTEVELTTLIGNDLYVASCEYALANKTPDYP